ncbi:MAG TPA: TRAM domain-containing protein, partial [Aquifex aeolicus]|nr:TRAM domain-containing protein [Aquifex aeolicus]
MRSSRSSEEATSKEKLRLSIEKLVYGGYGISRLSGKVAFVRYAAPKELVDVQVIEEKKDYLQALVKDVVI